MKKQYRFNIIISLLSAVALLLVLGGQSGVFKREKATANTFVSEVPSQSPQEKRSSDFTIISGKPTALTIPDLAIDLAVKDGVYDTNAKTWSLSTDAAHYALITPEPNNMGGNTFIYGHNRKNIFSKLGTIKAGTKAYVKTDNGNTFTYVFRKSIETTPYDDTLFHYVGTPILTLQTCSGLWYQNRQLFTFDFVEVSKS